MKALMRKELTELLVPFGIVFAAITAVWIGSARFWEVLLPPATEMIGWVALTSGLTGAVVGYLQFAGERWRGKLAYLCHRGTGLQGAFVAKAAAGLRTVALVGLGPPIVYTILAWISSPNRSIVHESLLWAYASAATIGASLYGLGALAANLRRRPIAGILLVPVGIVGLWVVSEMANPPWGADPGSWHFPVLHLALAGAFLLLASRVARAGADAELRLPSLAHLGLVVLSIPFVLSPCDIGTAFVQSELLHEAADDAPMIVRDKAKGEFIPVVRDEKGGHFRLEPDGGIGARVEYGNFANPDDNWDIAFQWGSRTWYGASDSPAGGDGSRASLTKRGLLPINARYHGPVALGLWAYLDLHRGTVRVFAYSRGISWSADPDRRIATPLAIEIGKPQGGDRFSAETLVLNPHLDDPFVERSGYVALRADEAPATYPCLADPADGSFWRLDPVDRENPLLRAELPGGDRFVRFEPRYQRRDLVYSRFKPSFVDPVVVGERGRYSWDGQQFVEAETSENYSMASESDGLVLYRVEVDEPDPLGSTVRILDAKDGRELFSHTWEPRGSPAALAAYAGVLLRPPLSNTLSFTGTVRPQSGTELMPQVPLEILLHDGRRPGLWILDLAVALVCAATCARILRRRDVGGAALAVLCAFVLLFGPFALLVVWLLESKTPARVPATAPGLPEPALAIQSVSV